MPRSRFYNLPKEKRAAILDAAAEEFAKDGFEGTSYNQIIERSGVSKGAMYYYFDDKEDLFGTVVQDVIGRMIDLVKDFSQVETPEGFLGELDKMIHVVGEYTKEHRRDVELMRGLLRADKGTFQLEILREIRRKNQVLVERILKQGQSVGAVRKDIPLSLLISIVEAQDETTDRWMAGLEETHTQEGLERWMRVAQDLMKRLILAPALLAEICAKRQGGLERR